LWLGLGLFLYAFALSCVLSRNLFRDRPPHADGVGYNEEMQRKVFWTTFTVLGLTADVTLPIMWSLLATIPIGILCWCVAYRSDWF